MTNLFNNLNEAEHEIADYLFDFHKGIGKAVSNRTLSEVFMLEERKLRQIITHLIVEHKVPIGSCSVNHSGIYFVSSDEDYKIASDELMGRVKKLSRRHKCLRLGWQSWKNEIVSKQLSLIEVG